jgi:predicted glycoside hydrolase/deacetylase ChbG (UPF0249 family)
LLLIVNADDLGANKEVNDTTLKLMKEGKITSATLLANAPNLEDALTRMKDYPNHSLGVHLNITEFAPILSDKDLNVIRDDNGNFIGDRKFSEVKLTSYLVKAIYNEFCAQIDKLISLGVKISHIDAHHHVHTIPKLFFVLKNIQKKYMIRKVRITRNIYAPHYKVSNALLTKKKLYNFMLRNFYFTKTTDGFGDFTSFYQNALLNNLKYDSVEVMVHPGGELFFKKESELLQSDWKKEIPFNLELINYNQL